MQDKLIWTYLRQRIVRPVICTILMSMYFGRWSTLSVLKSLLFVILMH
uniref:Uncharacterized protein n=1 Tax=Rhizophora mucronata TaxID=61149 RepID=A0A2P2MXP6_RHIMU